MAKPIFGMTVACGQKICPLQACWNRVNTLR
jgi:hypothetical protein